MTTSLERIRQALDEIDAQENERLPQFKHAFAHHEYIAACNPTAIRDLLAERDALKADAQWVKTTERRPSKPGSVLVVFADRTRATLANFRDGGFYDFEGPFPHQFNTPAYWRELPATPNTKD